MCEVLLLTMLNLAWQARFMIIHHQAGYLDVLLPDDGSQRHSIPTWNFSPTPEEHSHCPIAIHCPRNKWLISCKELLPKISTCFIHAVLLPPKLPTVETQKNKLHEPKYRWFTSKLAEGVFAWLERYCQVETLPIACKTFKCAFGGG